jgi:hypothetical protein
MNNTTKRFSDEDILSRGLENLSLQEAESVTPRLGDALIAKQLNKLSINEREHVIMDIHGVAELVKETPKLIDESLSLMLQEVDHLLVAARQKHQHAAGSNFRGTTAQHSFSGYHREGSLVPQYPTTTAYERALERLDQEEVISRNSCPSNCPTKSIASPDFRLSFLRAERFKPKAAAERMVRYFEEKERLFGVDLLTRDIRITDLDSESWGYLSCGRIQLAGKDTQGRSILIGLRKIPFELTKVESLVSLFGFSFYFGLLFSALW